MGWLLRRDNLWIKNSSKSLYLTRFSKYKHFFFWQFLRKIRKFKMAAIFGDTEIFWKIGMATLPRYPVGEKIRRNRSILHSIREITIFVFCNFCAIFDKTKFFLKIELAIPHRYPVGPRYKHFCKEIQKFKMVAILGETNFFLKIGMGTLQRYPACQKFSRNCSILARFSRYKHFCVL